MPFAGGAGLIAVAAGAALIATVFAALYHAEVVANRTGEPCGTPVLAVAVVIIEVTLIVSVMIAAPGEKAGPGRDTVFAAVMIVCNGTAGTTGASMSAIRDLVREEQRAINAPRRVSQPDSDSENRR